MKPRSYIALIPNVRLLRLGSLAGKALERQFAIAARENRKRDLSDLERIPNAITIRSFLGATSRCRKTPRDVPLSKSVIEVAYRWRNAYGQSLPGHVALHIGKKLLNEQIGALKFSDKVFIKASDERDEALTQLLSIVEPQLRVTVQAFLLVHLNQRAQNEKSANVLRPREQAMAHEELQAAVAKRVRRIETKGFEMIERCSQRATAFDDIEAGYDLPARRYG